MVHSQVANSSAKVEINQKERKFRPKIIDPFPKKEKEVVNQKDTKYS